VLDPMERPLKKFALGMAAAETGAASVEFIKKACIWRNRLHRRHRHGTDQQRSHQYGGLSLSGAHRTAGRSDRRQGVRHDDRRRPLRIMFVTTHVAIKDLSKLLTQVKIEKAIRLAHQALTKLYGIKNPRIGVAALNPHAGEHGLFGNEEARVILRPPAPRRHRGFWPATPAGRYAVRQGREGQYDGIVAMYHDQGLIPLKLVAFGTCVNLTVGLPSSGPPSITARRSILSERRG